MCGTRGAEGGGGRALVSEEKGAVGGRGGGAGVEGMTGRVCKMGEKVKQAGGGGL